MDGKRGAGTGKHDLDAWHNGRHIKIPAIWKAELTGVPRKNNPFYGSTDLTRRLPRSSHCSFLSQPDSARFSGVPGSVLHEIF